MTLTRVPPGALLEDLDGRLLRPPELRGRPAVLTFLRYVG